MSSPTLRPPRSKHHLVPAEVFCTTLCINARNTKLSDADFRQFVLASLSIVDFPAPSACMTPGKGGSDKDGSHPDLKAALQMLL